MVQVTLAEQQALWARLKAEEGDDVLLQWPHNDQVEAGYPPYEVQEHCVRNVGWQAVRLSMKGIPTHEKLLVLKRYWDTHWYPGMKNYNRITEIQVGNYLGALRRGGQLDNHNRIRKYI